MSVWNVFLRLSWQDFFWSPGSGIGFSGVEKIIAGTSGEDLMTPGRLALIAAVISFGCEGVDVLVYPRSG